MSFPWTFPHPWGALPTPVGPQPPSFKPRLLGTMNIGVYPVANWSNPTMNPNLRSNVGTDPTGSRNFQ